MIKKISFLSIFLFKVVIGTLAAESHILELNIIGGGTNLPTTSIRNMESNAVKLLTMMSDAQANGSKTLNFQGISISERAKKTILQMWKYQPLRVWADDDDVPPFISESLLNIYAIKCYQVRNIPVRLFPRETPGEDKYSEVAIDFSTNGSIVDFNIAIERNQYNKFVGEAKTVQDKENRDMLVKWMEQLQNAFITKNRKSLNRLFNDDAMTITGVSTFKRTGIEKKIQGQEAYEMNSKRFMASLVRAFSRDGISVAFENLDFGCDKNACIRDRNGEWSPRYYMVWCTLDWKNINCGKVTYHDTGRLFVLWNFKNPEQPTILVRAWTHPDDPKQFDVSDFTLE